MWGTLISTSCVFSSYLCVILFSPAAACRSAAHQARLLAPLANAVGECGDMQVRARAIFVCIVSNQKFLPQRKKELLMQVLSMRCAHLFLPL
jgi:hypothetical protein